MHIGFPALRHGDSVGQILFFTAGSVNTFSGADSRSGLMYEFFGLSSCIMHYQILLGRDLVELMQVSARKPG